jgi:Tol biopolymer transport system component
MMATAVFSAFSGAARARARRRAAGLPVIVALLGIGFAVLAPPAGAATVVRPVGLVSHIASSAVTAAGGTSTSMSSSADGAFVVFVSPATNVITAQIDANGVNDVFLYSRATGAVTLVSHSTASGVSTGNGASSAPLISADGNYVVFSSLATNLVTGQSDVNAAADLFLWTRATGIITLVSHAANAPTTTAGAGSSATHISADGGFVAFYSIATNLVTGQIDSNGTYDAFLYNRATGGVLLVSHTPSAAIVAGGAASFTSNMSADGAFVVFSSSASNLVTSQSDANGVSDIFLYTRATGVVTLVSHTPTAATLAANGTSFGPRISADGGWVIWQSYATNLVTGQSDANNERDAFLYNRATGAVTLVSHAASGPATTGNGFSVPTSISADGGFVGLHSAATNLVTGQSDANATIDVFVYDRSSGALALASHTPGAPATTGNGASSEPIISADGSQVAFQSNATNLVPAQTDTNAAADTFLYGRTTGAVTLVSHTAAAVTTTGAGASVPLALSTDGTYVTVQSTATNILAGQSDTAGTDDVFQFQRTTRGTAPADFDGNGSSDISVFRPAAGAWLIRNQPTVFLGAEGDIPVPCDYDGNGTANAAVFRPAVGGWYVDGAPTVFFGAAGDIPVPADYDGDGDCDRAIFRPSVGGWYIDGQATVFLGLSGDIPVPGDYDGNGTADVAVYRPAVGGWYRVGVAPVFFGLEGDVPVPGDYDGNGTTDIAIFRKAVGGWYVQGQAPQFLGLSSDIPQPGDYDGNGTTDLAVYRPATGTWYVGGNAPVQFGTSADIPLVLPAAIRMAITP